MSLRRPARAAVLSGGSWGTALAMVLADAGTRTVVHARRPEIAEAITARHRNPGYWPDHELPHSLTATTDLAACLAAADYLVVSIPAQTLRANLSAWTPHIGPGTVIVSLMKGVEAGTCKRATEVITDVTGLPARRVAVLSGPNIAREVMERQPTAATVACADLNVARKVQQVCHTPYFRPYTSTDVVGVELGGAIKNVIALAVGIAVGMGLGRGAVAMLITRGLAETTRLATAMGAEEATLAGQAGMGDLLATSFSGHSRNRTYGLLLGRGMTVEEASAASRQTTEGVKSAEVILDLARARGIDMPITEIVTALLQQRISRHEAEAALMQRPLKSEHRRFSRP